MDKLKLNNSLLENDEVLLNFFRIKYNYLPYSLTDLDSKVMDALRVIDDAYVNNSIDFDEAVNLISKLFGGLIYSNDIIDDTKVLNSDEFYSSLLDDKINLNELNKLLDNEKISYQLFIDGLNYLSREKEEDNAFSR